ncbi:PaaI family thioesterase [Actinomadura kijaniata]|uniref:PaaI family thioesterase n=1 Tax=Actinomadura kijaniata TaxID=46161 RepID=UPI001FE08030|nr:PaaI family thioesterase [Actinomadura kijaniata]
MPLSVETPPEHAEMWNTLSGAELIQAIGDGRFPEVSDVAHYIGQRIDTAEPGRVVISWTPGEHLCNPGGTVHGGFIATILDNAVCFASASTGEHFVPQLTLNLNIDYLRAVLAGGTYTVTGTCVHPGGTRLFSTAVITDADGRPVAQASGSTIPNRAFAR